MASSINKICVSGQIAIHTYCMRHHCIPKKITFWCGLWAGGIVFGPFFFRDEQDRHVTVNRNRYRSMITEYFWPQLDDMNFFFLDNPHKGILVLSIRVGRIEILIGDPRFLGDI